MTLTNLAENFHRPLIRMRTCRNFVFTLNFKKKLDKMMENRLGNVVRVIDKKFFTFIFVIALKLQKHVSKQCVYGAPMKLFWVSSNLKLDFLKEACFERDKKSPRNQQQNSKHFPRNICWNLHQLRCFVSFNFYFQTSTKHSFVLSRSSKYL